MAHFPALCQVQKEIIKVVVGLLAKSLDVNLAGAQNLGTTNRRRDRLVSDGRLFGSRSWETLISWMAMKLRSKELVCCVS